MSAHFILLERSEDRNSSIGARYLFPVWWRCPSIETEMPVFTARIERYVLSKSLPGQLFE